MPGLEDRLLTPGNVLLFGEIHGTEEAPELFADAVCAALARDRAVRVALEWSSSVEPAVRAFLTDDDEEAARQALLATEPWTRAYQDGRNSRAMLELLDELRGWTRAGRPVEVVFFDRRPTGGDVTRDALLAEQLADLAQSDAQGDARPVLLVLTGNLHARLTPGVPWDDTFEPMGYLLTGLLPELPIHSLDLSSTGGSAWICQGGTPDSCGAQKLGGAGSGDSFAIRLDDDLEDGFSGVYHVGAMTASPPAGSLSAGAPSDRGSIPSKPPT